jgi:hypothetical protein
MFTNEPVRLRHRIQAIPFSGGSPRVFGSGPTTSISRRRAMLSGPGQDGVGRRPAELRITRFW